MNFKKNELMTQVLDANFSVWSHTQNTKQFVTEQFLHKVDCLVFDNMKKQLKQAEIYNLLYLQENGYKLSLFQKLRIYFSGLKPLYKAERLREEQEIKERKEQREREEKQEFIREIMIRNASEELQDLLPGEKTKEITE